LYAREAYDTQVLWNFKNPESASAATVSVLLFRDHASFFAGITSPGVINFKAHRGGLPDRLLFQPARGGKMELLVKALKGALISSFLASALLAAPAPAQTYKISGGDLEATLDPATMSLDVAHRGTGVTWRMSRNN
jgi:hypothetical protein